MNLKQFREATKDMDENLKIELFFGDSWGVVYLPLDGFSTDGEFIFLEGGEPNE